MKSNYICILLALSLGVLSCNKEKPKRYYKYSYSHHALEYVQLSLGKYLIYKDSASSLLDSVVVTQSKLETKFAAEIASTWANLFNGTPEHYYDSFTLVLTKYESNTASDWFKGYSSSDASNSIGLPFPCDTVWVSMKAQDGFGVFYCSESKHPQLSMTVEGRIFNNVIEYVYSNQFPESHPDYKKRIYYWAKNTGIIKRSIINGSSIQTHTLLRNN